MIFRFDDCGVPTQQNKAILPYPRENKRTEREALGYVNFTEVIFRHCESGILFPDTAVNVFRCLKMPLRKGISSMQQPPLRLLMTSHRMSREIDFRVDDV